MSIAARTDTQSPALHVADSHDLIRVHGARVNNLKDVSVEIPKRRLTVFTGISGSGKSSLVFGTIAAESQRLINETYSAFVQGFMPTLARPEVDVLEGLTTAIIVDQERMGADPRSTVGTATDANAMLRILFSRLGQPYIGSPNAFSFNVPSVRASGATTIERGAGKTVRQTFTRTGRHVSALLRPGHGLRYRPHPGLPTTPSRLPRARSPSPAGSRTASGPCGSTPSRACSARWPSGGSPAPADHLGLLTSDGEPAAAPTAVAEQALSLENGDDLGDPVELIQLRRDIESADPGRRRRCTGSR
jgi:energy-coupling factor transporter ATP-binding protein EcfA2